MNKYMTNCDEATAISDKKQYKEASFWDRIKLKIHILTCKDCKEYTVQNDLLSKAYQKKATLESTKEKLLSRKDKDALKKELQDKMK